MAAPLSERILARTPEAAGQYHRLLLVVGAPRTGKTGALRDLAAEQDWPLINVNLRLAELLLELTHKQRAIRLPRLLGDLVAADGDDVVLLDNIELLFGPELALDPLRLLQGISRNRTVVATWCGEFEGDYLTYAEPGHPEARRYARPEAIIVPVDETSAPAQNGSPDAQAGNQETA